MTTPTNNFHIEVKNKSITREDDAKEADEAIDPKLFLKALLGHNQRSIPPIFKLWDPESENSMQRIIVRAAIVKKTEMTKF